MENTQAQLSFVLTDDEAPVAPEKQEVLTQETETDTGIQNKKGPHDHAASYGLPSVSEDAVDRHVYEILATVPSASTRGTIIEHLSRAVMHTAAGIPEAIIRPDRIPPNIGIYPLDKRYHIWQASLENLSFSQGFPAWLETGAPLWEACPFENAFHYKLFNLYKKLTTDFDQPIRELHMLPKHLTLMQANDPDIKAFMDGYTAESLLELYQCYSWSIRCHAFDLYCRTKEVKQHQRNAQSFLTKQQKNAEKLLTQLMDYFSQTEYDKTTDTEVPIWQLELKATDAFNALKTLHTISKDVLGVASPSTSSPGGIGNPLGQLPLNANLDTLMASIAVQGDMTKHPQFKNNNSDGEEKKGLRDENSMDSIRRLLGDKEKAAALQNAMLQLTGPDSDKVETLLQEERQRTGEYDEEGKLRDVGADQR